jgi:Putative type VII ESX secretion system translocon, EccE
MSDRLTYSFGPLERRGIAGGIAAGQLTMLAGGALLAILVLDHAPSAGGAMLAMVICAVAGVTAFAPLGGRTVHEWLPIAARFTLAKMLGDSRFVTAEPTVGTVAGTAGDTDAAEAAPAGAGSGRRARRSRRRHRRRAGGDDGPDLGTPPQLRGVKVVEAAYHDRPIGVLAERSGRLATAVLACRVGSFSLLDHEAQERRLARWGLVLSGAGGGPIRRLQWIERTAPAQGDQLARWVHEERDPSIPPRGTAMIESYLELISTSTKVAQEHEVLLAVQIDARRARERRRGPAVQTLLEQTERVAQGLEAAEVTVLGALTPGQLARTLRTAFDPYARAELTALQAAEPGGGDPASNSWPVGAREAWDHYESDGAMHATYWISAWPRVEVSPMFMDSLLGHSSAVRTVSVTFEPLSIDRSTREIEAAVTRDRADRELRARFGQSETARQRQAADATRLREAELAAGHGEVRLSGFITVSGRDADDLRRACGEVMEHAARARLELRRLYGQQADALTFTLPLCRGLR